MKPRILLLALAIAWMPGCDRSFIGAFSQNQNSLCAPPQGVATVLAYPAPNATGIPDNVGEIVFASTAILPESYRAYLIDVSAGGAQSSQVNFGNVGGYPLTSPPAGSATPPFSPAYYQASLNISNTVFPSGHTIEVALQQQKCNTSGAYGYFTVK